MANVVITTLANTAFNGSFVNKLNANLTKLADAVNNDVLWRSVGPVGAQTMRQHLDMNSFSIFNAVVDNVPLLEVKRKAYASSEYADESRKWAVVSEAYAEDAEEAAAVAVENAAISVDKASQLSQAVSDVAANKAAISSLSSTVTANKSSADATASSLSTLSSTVASNKTAADATASSLVTLSSTVTTNKVAADATATSLSTLNTTVSGHTASINTLTANAPTYSAGRLSVPTAAGVAKTQGGSTVVSTDANGLATITFPTAFSSSVVTVTVCNGDYQAGGDVVVSVNGFSSSNLTNFQIRASNSASQARRINWTALGV